MWLLTYACFWPIPSFTLAFVFEPQNLRRTHVEDVRLLFLSLLLCISLHLVLLFVFCLSFPSSSSFSSFSPLTEHDVTSISATVLLCVLQREVHAEGGVAIVGGAPGPWAAPALLGAGCVRVTQPLCACFPHPRGRVDGSACLAR